VSGPVNHDAGGPQDGVAQDGVAQDGVAQDGGTQDGATQEGAAQEGGVTQGGVTQGGVTEGGVTQGGVTEGGVTQGAYADLVARIAELEDLRLRALADLDNTRKRCAAQVSRAEEETRAAVARQWLPVLDNLDLALAHATADPGTIVDGVRAIHAQALDVLARLGFPRRDDRGARFDPARHEAVATRPDPGVAADLVADVIRPAYGDGDHQLRPAQVVVARPG
jgi:molecular chaperone GrpE